MKRKKQLKLIYKILEYEKYGYFTSLLFNPVGSDSWQSIIETTVDYVFFSTKGTKKLVLKETLKELKKSVPSSQRKKLKKFSKAMDRKKGNVKIY